MMRNYHILLVITLFAAFVVPTATLRAETQEIPDNVMKELKGKLQLPSDVSRKEARKMLPDRMREIIAMGEDIEKRYPKAKDLYKVRMTMLRAAQFLATQMQDKEAKSKLTAISDRLVKSDAPTQQKIVGSYFLASSEIDVNKAKGDAAAKIIDKFVDKHKKGEGAADALAFGIFLARKNQLEGLANKYLDELEKNHSNEPKIRALLKRMGRGDVSSLGKVFKATLTTLDGKKVNLPEDMLGKVVVIDFWATWCPPCRASMPGLRNFYAEYKAKGVEIIGISMDRAGSEKEVKKFIADQKLGWIQTYSGKAWQDPTAASYGVQAIPSVWVIGKDGKVVSSDAHMKLEEIVKKALLAKPAAKATSTAKPVEKK